MKLSVKLITQISKNKQEPLWMLDLRLKAFKHFEKREMPNWGADLSQINFDEITYYLDPKFKNKKLTNTHFFFIYKPFLSFQTKSRGHPSLLSFSPLYILNLPIYTVI